MRNLKGGTDITVGLEPIMTDVPVPGFVVMVRAISGVVCYAATR